MQAGGCHSRTTILHCAPATIEWRLCLPVADRSACTLLSAETSPLACNLDQLGICHPNGQSTLPGPEGVHPSALQPSTSLVHVPPLHLAFRAPVRLEFNTWVRFANSSRFILPVRTIWHYSHSSSGHGSQGKAYCRSLMLQPRMSGHQTADNSSCRVLDSHLMQELPTSTKHGNTRY
jgi:hypothetical protein